MNTKEIREHLESALAALDSFDQTVFQPAADITVKEAVAKLSAALPKFTVEMRLRKFECGDDFNLLWKIWDGAHYHEGSTLAAAVNVALDANRPATDAVAECDAAIGTPAECV